MPYDLFEHRNRFAQWVAARAAQRRFTSVENLRDALDNCGIVDFLRTDEAYSINDDTFNNKHKEWCNRIIDFFKSRDIKDVTYGRAAKLVAVYLKSMVIIGPHAHSSLASVAHPPIDRILLQNLCRTEGIEIEHRRIWRNINWTQLDEKSYCTLVFLLRDYLGPNDPFWMLERFWTVTND